MRVTTAGPAATEAAGADLAGRLRPGDVVLVRGELGAGKTTFVRGACRALGVSGPVTSPTFAIGNVYVGADVEIAHLDLYRLSRLALEEPGLVDDYATRDRITLVEWPEAAAAELESAPGGGATLTVTISHAGGDERVIEVP